MPALNSPRGAKEYLIAQIVAQAARDTNPLSAIETDMLSFSETAWTLPEMSEVSAAFDCDYDRSAYEARIKSLAWNARMDAKRQGALPQWNEAVKLLGKEDHYLLVLLPRTVTGSIGRTKLLLGILLFAAIFALLISLMVIRA